MFKPKSILLYTWHHSWTHWTYSLEKLIQTELPFHLSLASGCLFSHLSFPEISQCCVLFPVFFCDQKWTVRWRVKYLRGKVQRAIHGVTFNGDMKTGQTNMWLTDIPCHDVTIGCLSHNLRSTLQNTQFIIICCFTNPASTILIFPYSKTQTEGKLDIVNGYLSQMRDK